MSAWRQELIKAVFTCASGLILLALGWFVGQRLTYQWNLRQKRREIQLSALQQFYVAYGEFFAVWKLWNRLRCGPEERETRRWELENRAATAEGSMEGILVKLASELRLNDSQIETLGSFRQAYQQLRQNIRRDLPLPWPSSDSPEYQTFKSLAVSISALMAREWPSKGPAPGEAAGQLLDITSNKWEATWVRSSRTVRLPRSRRRRTAE